MTDPAENVEIVRRAYERWSVEGIDGLATVMHPEVEWHPPPQAPEPGPYRGAEEVLRMAASYMESFERFEPVPDRIVAGTEAADVVVLATLRIRGRGSGATVEMPVGHLVTLRDGRVTRFQVFTEPAEALAAAGLDPAG